MTADSEIVHAHIGRIRKGFKAAAWICPILCASTAIIQRLRGEELGLAWLIAATLLCISVIAATLLVGQDTPYKRVLAYVIGVEMCGFAAVLLRIAYTGGANSPYNGGFILALLGSSFLLPLNSAGILILYPLSLATYATTIILTSTNGDALVTWLSTATWACIICGVGAWFHYQTLREAFSWRSALREEARRADLGLERARIARDLHDHIGARLTGIALRAEREQRRLAADAHPALIWIQDTVRLCLEELRDTIWALSNSGRDARELVATLRRRAEDIADAAGLELFWKIDDPVWNGTLSPGVSVALSAILREALTNTIRHSGAKKVTVTLERLDKVIKMSVADDGRGMGEHPNEGRGMNNMRARANEQHGDVRIERGEDDGLRVVAEIPWREDILQDQRAA